MKRSESLVFYHAECMDGCAAAAVFRMWADERHIDYDLIPLDYSDPIIPEKAIDKDVYFLDFSINDVNLMFDIVRVSNSVTIFDHHKSSHERYSGFIEDGIISGEINVSGNESGATVTWKNLFPNKDLPMALRFARDYDLWKHTFHQSRYLARAMEANNFSIIEMLACIEYKSQLHEALQRGEAINDYVMSQAKKEARNYRTIPIEGYDLPLVNCSKFFRNEVLDFIIQRGYDAAIAYNNNGQGTFDVSFRSNGKIDVKAIAEKFGGGGHVTSAGCRVYKIEEILEK